MGDNPGAERDHHNFKQYALIEDSKGMTHSRADILNRLSGILGPPAQPSKLHDYTDVHASHYQLPEAYIGKNTLIQGWFNSNLVNKPENWQTRFALPIRENTEGLSIQWDQTEYSRNIIPETPYEAASRLAHTRKRTSQARVVRRGQAIMAESDFFRTREGLIEWYNEIEATKQSVQLTLNYDVMFAILTSSNYAKEYDKMNGGINPNNMYSNFKRELQSFACLNKGDSHGLDLAFEQARRQMLLHGVTPDMVIMDPRTMLHFAMVPEERRYHMFAGETGVKQYDAYNASDPAFTYRGLNCFVQTSFHTGTDGQDVSMLCRNTMIGEFAHAKKEATQPDVFPNYMDRLIYDQQHDKCEKISGKQALEYSCPDLLFAHMLKDNGGDTEDGRFNTLKHFFPMYFDKMNKENYRPSSEDSQMSESSKMAVNKITKSFDLNADKIAEFNKKPTNPAVDIYTHVQDAIFQISGAAGPTEWSWWSRMYELTVGLGYKAPFSIYIVRPFIEHKMLSMVVMKGGESTGTTLYGHSDFQISANTNNKTVEGHLTFHSKAIVYNPQNIYVLEDVQCLDYIAGGNTMWLGDETEIKESTSLSLGDKIKEAIKQRLASTGMNMTECGSMLAFYRPSKLTETNNDPLCFGIGMGPDRWQHLTQDTPSDKAFPGGNTFHQKYQQLFGFTNLYSSVDHVASMTGSYIRAGKHVNTIVFKGPSRFFTNAGSEQKVQLIPGVGHFGPDARDGDALWRRGDQMTMSQTRQLTTRGDVMPASVGANMP